MTDEKDKKPPAAAKARAALTAALRTYTGSSAALIVRAIEEFVDAKIGDAK